MKPRNRNVMVWGCFSASGTEQLAVIDSTMNQHHIKVCLKIILGHLSKIWSWYESGSFNGSWSHSYLQIHQGMTQKGEGGGGGEWPCQSPVLNLISNLCPFFCRNLKKVMHAKSQTLCIWRNFERKKGQKFKIFMSKINGWYSKCKPEVVFSYIKKAFPFSTFIYDLY